MSSKTPRMAGEVHTNLSLKTEILDAFREGFDLNNCHNIPPISYRDYKPKRSTRVTVYQNLIEFTDIICKENLRVLTHYARELGEECGVVLSYLDQGTKINHIWLDLRNGPAIYKHPYASSIIGWHAYTAGCTMAPFTEGEPYATKAFCHGTAIYGGEKI